MFNTGPRDSVRKEAEAQPEHTLGRHLNLDFWCHNTKREIFLSNERKKRKIETTFGYARNVGNAVCSMIFRLILAAASWHWPKNRILLTKMTRSITKSNASFSSLLGAKNRQKSPDNEDAPLINLILFAFFQILKIKQI